MTHSQIFPLLTEKSVAQAKQGRFTFLVGKGVTSHTVAQAVQALYNVHPTRVNMVMIAAKHKGIGTIRTRPARRKAVVTLKKGEKIVDFQLEEQKAPAKKADANGSAT